MLRNLLSAIGSYASLAGLYYSIRPASTLSTAEISLLVISAVLVVTHISFEISAFRRGRPKSLRNDADIKHYMEKFTQGWRDGGGRTSVLARDMSWVDDETAELLIKLARHRNLTLFMAEPNNFATRLNSQGAEIIFYRAPGFSPLTRFAITNEGRADAQVVIGFKNQKGHLEIQEYTHEHTIFYLCSDIIALLRATGRKPR